MDAFISVLCLLFGTALGALITFLVMRTRVRTAYAHAKAESEAERATLIERVQSRDQSIAEETSELRQKDDELHQQRDTIVQLEKSITQVQQALKDERQQNQEKLALLNDAKKQLSDTFDALAAKALQGNSQSFLELAKSNLEKYQETAKGDLEKRQQAINELVTPIKQSLEKFDAKTQQLEKDRITAFTGINEQVKSLAEGQIRLHAETSNLVRALRTPNVRGRWGEIQLRNVVEIAGMQEYCDFEEQKSVQTENGQLRPDMLVKLPGGRNIVVDSKVPLSAYLEALEAQDDDTRKQKLLEHAQQVRKHLVALGKKCYFDQFDPTPDFVVMFIPGEAFFYAALMEEPKLIEIGVEQNVLIATPTTLIALLKAVAYGWRQEKLAQNALEISQLAKELYNRFAVFGDHFADTGDHLGKAVTAYNKAATSLESRLLVQVRKFKELGVVNDSAEIETLHTIDSMPRQLQAPELLTPVMVDGAPSLLEVANDGESKADSIKPR